MRIEETKMNEDQKNLINKLVTEFQRCFDVGLEPADVLEILSNTMDDWCVGSHPNTEPVYAYALRDINSEETPKREDIGFRALTRFEVSRINKLFAEDKAHMLAFARTKRLIKQGELIQLNDLLWGCV